MLQLGAGPGNLKVAELFCKERFGEEAQNFDFERGLVFDLTTGWDLDEQEQMDESERRIYDEEPVLLLGVADVQGVQSSAAALACDRKARHAEV